nr:hypothetical protein Iba_chr12bCG14430 [Ipomoea batatas]
MCSPNSVPALQPTPSSSAPSLQFPTLPTRCRRLPSPPLPSPTPPLPDGEAPVGCPRRSPSPSITLGLQVAVSHVITGRRLSPLPLLEVQSTSPSPSPSPTLQDSRSPSPSLTPGLQVKKQQALDKKGVEKIAKSALSPQTKPKTSTGQGVMGNEYTRVNRCWQSQK